MTYLIKLALYGLEVRHVTDHVSLAHLLSILL